jgi:16S rRNA (guanine527-N7)-methyltransferase
MIKLQNTNQFMESLKAFELGLEEQQIQSLFQFSTYVLEDSQKINLISETDKERILTRHILDSLLALKITNDAEFKLWIDFGSGAGFPLIPLAIARPETSFLGIEPRKNRNTFLNKVRRNLNLKNLEIFHGRAEQYPKPNTADFASARAVGAFAEDYARAEFLLKKGGSFITFKSNSDFESLKALQIQYFKYQLPNETESRYIVATKRN